MSEGKDGQDRARLPFCGLKIRDSWQGGLVSVSPTTHRFLTGHRPVRTTGEGDPCSREQQLSQLGIKVELQIEPREKDQLG